MAAKKKPEQQPQAEQAGQNAVPVLRKCQALNCKVEIEVPKLFCDTHWTMVPVDIQTALFDAVGVGVLDLVRQVLKKAINLIAECERQQSGAS